MIVYGSSLSPFVRKVLIFAAEKGVAVENSQVGVGSTDPDFLAVSPFGKIPAMRDGDFGLADSTAIVTYIDTLHPDPNLIPTDARARARCIWFEEFADTLMMSCGAKMFFNRVVAPVFMRRPGDLAVADKAEAEELPPLLDYLETQMTDSGYLVEDRFTLADIAVAGPLVNVIHHLGIVIDPARHPRTLAYAHGIHARPSFAAWLAKEQALLARFRPAMPAAV